MTLAVRVGYQIVLSLQTPSLANKGDIEHLVLSLEHRSRWKVARGADKKGGFRPNTQIEGSSRHGCASSRTTVANEMESDFNRVCHILEHVQPLKVGRAMETI